MTAPDCCTVLTVISTRSFVVVPGFGGNSLADRTCPHFDEWLGRIVVKCATRARSLVYDHDLRLDALESWEKYCTSGNVLLEQLLLMHKTMSEVSFPPL